MKDNKNKWVKRGIGILLIIVLIGGGIFYFVNNSSGVQNTSTRTYQTQAVTKNNISIGVSGSGTLSPVKSESVQSSYEGTVAAVHKKVGDSIKAGEVIATVSSEELDKKISECKDQIKGLEVKIAGTDQTTSNKYITSGVAGVVKLIKASAGDLAEDVVNKYGYLCVISTDGKMKVTFTTDKTVKKYTSVTVKNGAVSDSGTVTEVNGKSVTVEIDKNTYTIGQKVKVYGSGGKLLGSGKLQLCETVPVTETEGKISSVLVSNNQTVYSSTKLFQLKNYTTNSEYQSLIEQKKECEEQLDSLNQQKNISFDFDGTITALPVSKGDTVGKDTTLCTVKGKKGFKLTVGIDELDISNIKLNDKAVITLDAIEGEFSGKVSYISNEGNTESSVTNYDVVITTENIEGALTGMNATANITTQSSGDSLVVPVNAVITKGGESYIYLAPEGSDIGDEVDQSSVNTDELTRAYVTTGMSDGNFIVVEGGELAEGTLIYVPVVTTTSESSGSTNERTQMRFIGGDQMPGGQMPEDKGGNMVRIPGGGSSSNSGPANGN